MNWYYMKHTRTQHWLESKDETIAPCGAGFYGGNNSIWYRDVAGLKTRKKCQNCIKYLQSVNLSELIGPIGAEPVE